MNYLAAATILAIALLVFWLSGKAWDRSDRRFHQRRVADLRAHGLSDEQIIAHLTGTYAPENTPDAGAPDR